MLRRDFKAGISKSDSSIGYTSDLTQRLGRHHKIDQEPGPWELVHEEKFATRIETCECTGDWIHERDARLIVNVVIG
jgi:hypothetical protein